MLEQVEKLPVSDVLRFCLASAEFSEAVCIICVKDDELRRVLTFKVDDAAADQMLGRAKRVKHTVHQIRAAYIQLAIISAVLPELSEQKSRSVENARDQALLGMAGDSSVHGLGKVACVDFDRLVRERVIGDKLTIEIPYEISNALFALGKLNGIMMQEIFDFGIERTVALVLSALLQFGVKGKFSTFSSLECLERISFIIYICAFLSGLFVLVICSIMLYPKRTLYFDNEKLKKLYDLRQEYDGEFDKAILSENMKCVDCNMAPINRLQNYNQIASFALIVMVLCFIICGILFLL